MASVTKIECNQCHKILSNKRALKDHERTHSGEKPYACEVCGKSFANRSYVTSHRRRTHTFEKPHRCTTCDKRFATASKLTRHKIVHSEERNYACSLCPVSFKTRATLMVHQRTHTGEKNFKCSFCEKAYTSREALDRHLRVHTGEKPFRCTEGECGREFYTIMELRKHGKSYHAEPTLGTRVRRHTCDVCHRQFSHTRNLLAHKTTQHDPNPPRYSCDECGKFYSSRNHLATHQLLHSGVKPEKCQLCVAAFKTRRDLTVHMRRRHTGEKPFACFTLGCDAKFCTSTELAAHNKCVHMNEKNHGCPHCPVECTSKSNLTVHMRVHTDERPYACDACEKRFRSSSTFNQHLRSHLGEKPYACSKCEKRYRDMSTLKSHMSSIHQVAGAAGAKRNLGMHKVTRQDPNPPRYSCDECDKTYKSHAHLSRHQLIHSGVKAEKCSFCVSAFKTRVELKAHVLRRHTGQKPFACSSPACNVKFCTRAELTSHNKYIHSTERHHSCSHCPTRCVTKTALSVHMRRHTGGKPYACSECDKWYKDQGSLNWHMLSIHQVAGADAAKRQCAICQKVVSVKSFKKHEKIHTSDNNQQGDQGACENPRSSARQFTRGVAAATNAHSQLRPVVVLRRLEDQFPAGY